MSISCEVCGRAAPDHTLYRANAKGEKGRWRCKLHLNEQAAERAFSPEIKGIVKILENKT